uniref:Uncharacterized protein n=1 Tax=Oryza glumipatula TaxID=40148 RepID=A0A0D9Z3X4_9ORYZ
MAMLGSARAVSPSCDVCPAAAWSASAFGSSSRGGARAAPRVVDGSTRVARRVRGCLPFRRNPTPQKRKRADPEKEDFFFLPLSLSLLLPSHLRRGEAQARARVPRNGGHLVPQGILALLLLLLGCESLL